MTTCENTKVWFIPQSGNTKTGIMSVTYTTENTCPARCPFKKNGCYAENFPCCLQWKKTAQKGTKPENLKNIIKNSVHSDVIRHNVAGDLAKNHSNNIDKSLVENLCKAYKNLKAYTYTHCSIIKKNIEIVKKAMQENFVINFSTENVKDAKKAMENGCNAVIACNSISDKVIVKNGIKIVQCPATYNKEKHCQNCGLCWQKNRGFVIAFPVHGNGKNKAKKAGFLIDL
jgi:hypothetical protein